MWKPSRIFDIRVLSLCATALLALLVVEGTRPPTDQALIQRFTEKRATYDQLRDLMGADDKLRVVATWGFQTFASPLILRPPTSDLSLARYTQYLSNLKLLRATRVYRSERRPSDVCIDAWGAGWAGDTRHVDICWLPRQTLEAANARVRIAGNWFITKDL
jgi:hypothetical protein